MGEVDIDLSDAHSNDGFNRRSEIADRFGAKNAVGFQGNPGPGQYLRNSRGQMSEAPFPPRKILSQSIKAQDERKTVFIKKPQDGVTQEAPVCREGIPDFPDVLLIHSFRIFDGPFELIKREKRLTAIKINDAFRGEKRIEEIDCLCEGRESQELLPLRLVTIGAMIVTSVCQYDRKARKVRASD